MRLLTPSPSLHKSPKLPGTLAIMRHALVVALHPWPSNLFLSHQLLFSILLAFIFSNSNFLPCPSKESLNSIYICCPFLFSARHHPTKLSILLFLKSFFYQGNNLFFIFSIEKCFLWSRADILSLNCMWYMWRAVSAPTRAGVAWTGLHISVPWAQIFHTSCMIGVRSLLAKGSS